MTMVLARTVNDVGDRFLDLLHRNGINPPQKSAMEDELLSIVELVEIWKNRMTSPSEEVLSAASGLHDLAAKVLSVETCSEFANFLPHLRLIAGKRLKKSKGGQASNLPDDASLRQNDASGYADDTARKMAELYVACLAVHVGTNIELDNPTNAKGDNPDILFTLNPATSTSLLPSEQWALAIKTISSTAGQTIFERIKEAAEQIDAPTCPAQRGMVIINAKDAINHKALKATTYPDLNSAIAALKAQLDALIASAEMDRPQSEWDALFTGRTVRPILFMGQSMVWITDPSGGGNVPTQLKMMTAYGVRGTLDRIGGSLAKCLNQHMQNILLGIPGTPGTATHPGTPPM